MVLKIKSILVFCIIIKHITKSKKQIYILKYYFPIVNKYLKIILKFVLHLPIQ